METLDTFKGFDERHLPLIVQKVLKNQREICEILPSCLGQVKRGMMIRYPCHEGISHTILLSTNHLASQGSDMTALELKIVSRVGYHLCVVIYYLARHLQTECSIEIKRVSFESHPTLLALYGE
jgi:hypothetical protein